MKSPAAWAISSIALLSACELVPPPSATPEQRRVPTSFLDARLSPGHREHLALTGEKQLACRDCHAISDAGFAREAIKPCAECHADQQKHHHPFDGGVPLTCFSCHAFQGTGEHAGVDRWGCVRCHDTGEKDRPQIGGIHKEHCESCHRPHGSPFTLAADCGQCHDDITVAHGKGEKAFVADTCMACHPHHTRAEVASSLCTDCHASAKVPAKARVSPKAIFADGHKSCGTCHVAHAFTAETTKECGACHAEVRTLASEKHGPCNECHQPHLERSASKACESCHPKVHLEHPKDAEGRPCLGCHPVHAPAQAQPLAVPCTSCHNQPIFTAAVVHATKTSCASCHEDPHAGKIDFDKSCQRCHAEEHAAARKVSGHSKCGECHQGLPHGPPTPPAACLTCHEKKQPPQKGHDSCGSCHASHSGEVMKPCAQCHEVTNLPGLHLEAKHQGCNDCHAPHTPEPGFGPATCMTCHKELSKKSHPTPPKQCVSCHLFKARR